MEPVRRWSSFAPAITPLTRRLLVYFPSGAHSQPGEISAVMAIALDYAGSKDVSEPLTAFEDVVVPLLVAKSSITSIYGGVGHRLAIHYVLRITASLEGLFALINEVHAFAHDARPLITTSTYVVINKLANLNLQRTFLIPTLPPEEDQYRQTHILPYVDADARVRFVAMAQEAQVAIFKYHRKLGVLHELADQDLLPEGWDEFQRKPIKGLVGADFELLSIPHNILSGRVEDILKELIKRKVADATLESWRGALLIRSGKGKAAVSFTERIKVVAKAATEQLISAALIAHVDRLGTTTLVRNAIAHREFERITIDALVDALIAYGSFILHAEGLMNV